MPSRKINDFVSHLNNKTQKSSLLLKQTIKFFMLHLCVRTQSGVVGEPLMRDFPSACFLHNINSRSNRLASKTSRAAFIREICFRCQNNPKIINSSKSFQ